MTSDGIVVTLPVGRRCVQAASLKRSAVTESVPLRWQSRMVASCSLRDHGGASNGNKKSIERVSTKRERRREKASSFAENKLVVACQKQRPDDMKHTGKQKKKKRRGGGSLDKRMDKGGGGAGESDGSTEGGKVTAGRSSYIRESASAMIVPSIPTEGRLPTAPMHTAGKVPMRRLGLRNHDASSVVFEQGYTRLMTRRVILDRWVRLQ